MAEAIIVSGPISGTDKTLSFETGKLAFQSQGAVVAKIAGTEALVTANAAKGIRDGIDFFPLTVDVEERMYAAGRIPGSFFRREGRPTDAAILACRLIDRPLRPSFADGFRNETQVVVTVMGSDKENPYDVLAINGASAALSISGIPFQGPIGAVRIAYSADGTWVPHPTFEEVEESTFELIVAGRGVGEDVAIMMVEAGGTEKAWDHYQAGAPKVTEEVIADGLESCKVWIKESIDLQLQLVEQVKAGRGITPLEFTPVLDYQDDVKEKVEALVGDALGQAGTIAAKAERNAATDAAIASAIEQMGEEFAGRTKEIKEAARSIQKGRIRARTVNEGIRIDGRGPADLRTVTSEVGVLGQAHGSGLFQRGETQVLSALTLGMPKMDQLLDNLGDKPKKRYMHHYNMPPHANGETGRVGSPKRREIGHGLLAERALLPVVPSLEEWAYTLRVVSEVLSSNGSTSMGSVCGSTLALMDGGVPIKAPVAGIAMGLIYDGGKYTTLTDILGTEDAFGDMDFKVAGTSEFVTALQLDTKIDGLPADVLAQALQQAKEARLAILDIMQKAIAEPRAEVGETAPKVISFEIPIDKIGEVIGPKGKVINAIQAETGADISVDDDGMVGTVTLGSPDKGAIDEAERQIKLILNPPTADVGAVYPGRVVNITKFGAFVNILPGRDGLLHISKIGGGKRIDKVEDVFSLGDEVEVKVDDVDPNGKVSLSLAGAIEIPDSAVSSGGGGSRDRGDRAPRDRAPRVGSGRGERCRGRVLRGHVRRRGRPGVRRPGPRRHRGWRTRRRAPWWRSRSPRWRSAVAEPHMTDLLDPGVEQTELPNGLRIVTETMPEARSVSLGAWVRVGGRDEPGPLSGASHFLEHLLFKGTERRSARQIAEAVDSVGGEMNAFTAREHTAYYARLPHARLDVGLDILCDVLSEPALRPSEVEAERQVIVEEILMNLDAPEDRVHTALSQAVFGDHSLGREVLGEMATVEAITRDEIADFFHRWYRPATMVITAAGRLDHEAVVATVAAGLGGGDGGELPMRTAPSPPVATTIVERDDTEQAHLCLGWRSLANGDDDRWAMSVANQVLGGGMASRLFQEVREQRGLAYSVYSHPTAFEDSGYLTIYCGTAPKRAREALGVIDDVVMAVLADGVTEAELAVAAGYLEGSMLLGLEDSGGRMGRLGRSLMQRTRIVTIDEHVERLRAVTAADVSRVLHRVLDSPRCLAAVGPFEAEDLVG